MGILGKEPMLMRSQKKYVVTLSAEERSILLDMISKGKGRARTLLHARILLKCDSGSHGENWTDRRIADALETTIITVERVRKRLVEGGMEAALNRKPQANRFRKVDGDVEAHLIATACASPPDGRPRWTLRLLADRLVELELVDHISMETVRKTLKKTNSNPG